MESRVPPLAERPSIPRSAVQNAKPPALAIRPIRPSDQAELQRAFEALSPESRYYRFHAPLRRLPDALARYLTNVDGVDHVALVAYERGAPFGRRGVAVARYIHDRARPGYAELAITVADRVQGRGVARPLLEAIAVRARWHGIHTFTMLVLRENRRACRFVARLGGVAQGSSGGVATYHVPVSALCGHSRLSHAA